MSRWATRRAAVPAVVLVGLFGLAALALGTELGWRLKLLRSFTLACLLGGLAIGLRTEGTRRLGVLVAVVGVVTFLTGIVGAGQICNDMRYPATATHGLSYDVSANLLEFGDTVDGAEFRCHATPIRSFVLLGYALTSLGVFGAVRDRS